MVIHTFNPETDYAIAKNLRTYTPSAKVAAMRRQMSLLPALYAEEGDCILIPDDVTESQAMQLPFYELTRLKFLGITTLGGLKNLAEDADYTVSPWGWNSALVRQLYKYGVPEDKMPTEEDVSELRELSSKATSRCFFEYAGIPESIDMPQIFTSLADAMAWYDEAEDVCFKAPWSSSGRGIIFTRDMNREQTEQWVHGILRAQQMVIGERRYGRRADLASEWILADGEVQFMGLSLFHTSGRGKYKGNVLASDKEIVRQSGVNEKDISRVLESQHRFIENYVGRRYNGPLGFDMLITPVGVINPCVEINFRNTMGMVAIAVRTQMEGSTAAAEWLKREFPNGILRF